MCHLLAAIYFLLQYHLAAFLEDRLDSDRHLLHLPWSSLPSYMLWHYEVYRRTASATVCTMVEMAKAHSLNIYGYFKFLLGHLPSKDMVDEQLKELAPWSEKLQSMKSACEFLQLAKGWGYFKNYRSIIWQLQ